MKALVLKFLTLLLHLSKHFKQQEVDELGRNQKFVIMSLIGSLHVSKQQEVDEFGRNWKLVDLIADWVIAHLLTTGS